MGTRVLQHTEQPYICLFPIEPFQTRVLLCACAEVRVRTLHSLSWNKSSTQAMKGSIPQGEAARRSPIAGWYGPVDT
jgi:hypothetical protein